MNGEYESRPDFLKNPGNRLAREIELLMTDVEKSDVPEILHAVTSEIPRALDEALLSGALTDEQKSEMLRRISDIRQDAGRLPESDEKQMVMGAFRGIQARLGE
ncbi:MAG: hypothetical protein A2898_03315 [Candidatus Kerfeldbacteria bacterium RIFCSPLOWO2_01_FULL_48_11]|uniref:Uncharacterized protein n=1 Tax=Candidatus Kerfeldbacteria bacterium RIFCSPLOWO2_01_FULL_48_11 TaxID=1798543 RepID=A0A1G2B2A8_9BACT|nr:MAG: hypothetical protein A2898_03315 [Candidatus Kerfeldbacteria bacterium RIFCSPLOWO2_01_FULL_48_11]HCM67599.1 hypothetical protein [Candidatus Kerfeldbacteria bacterium]